jgi:predicted transcriptional regulator
MYTYIAMERTQIYLTEQEAEVLDRLAAERKTTRSHLIREAIDTQYLSREERIRERLAALEASAGAWAHRDDIPDGKTYVERIRSRPGLQYDVPLGTDEDPL